jgi:hypothetical protein
VQEFDVLNVGSGCEASVGQDGGERISACA